MKKVQNYIRVFMTENLTAPQIEAIKFQLIDKYGISEVIIDRDLAHTSIKKWRQEIWLEEIGKFSPEVKREDLFPEVKETVNN